MIPLELLYWDVAIFDDERCSRLRRDYDLRRDFQNMLHLRLNRQAGKKFVSGEIKPEGKESLAIELAVNSATDFMISFRRDKIIKVFSLIQLVPENRGYDVDPVFGGIVIEKAPNLQELALETFLKVFLRMCFSGVLQKEGGFELLHFDDSDLKKGVTSLMTRRFYEGRVINNELFKTDKVVIPERYFDIESERRFKEVMAIWGRENLIPSDKLFPLMVGCVINGNFRSWHASKRNIVREEKSSRTSFFIYFL